MPALTTNQNAGFVTVPSENKINGRYNMIENRTERKNLHHLLYISGVSKAKCSPNPCRNDGVCTAFEKHYECECPMGFMGKDCEGMLGGINYRAFTTHGLSKYKAIHDHRM